MTIEVAICCNFFVFTQSITAFSLLIFSDTAHSERYMGMATPNDNLNGYEVSIL